nr:hypothetical protein [Streptomonospora litoralis]
MRQIVHEHARAWPTDQPVYVGCSGNMTIERTLADLTRPVHSNDVNPYSCALGWYLSGQRVPFTLKEDSREALGWLEPSLDHGAGTLATLMLGTRFLEFVGRDTPYHRRMVQAYRDQWDRMHAATVAKLHALTLRTSSFYAGDVRTYLDAVPDDAPFASFPPFWAAGYKQMFKGIEQHFDWPEPEFTELDEAGKSEIIQRMTDRPHWLLGLHYRDPDLEPYRVGYVQLSPRAVPIEVYARPGAARWAGPRQKTEPIKMPKIGADEEVEGPLTLHPLSAAQFAGLRSMCLDRRIAPGMPHLAVGVAAAGRLIGAFGYLPPKFDPDCAYLMSDFPIGWSKYKRLSKLIVMAATSSEAQALLQRSLSKRLTSWATTAFTDNPTSGKYGRGIPGIKLRSRKPCEVSDHTWQLDYGGPLGSWTLAEALEMWEAKHAQHTKAVTR